MDKSAKKIRKNLVRYLVKLAENNPDKLRSIMLALLEEGGRIPAMNINKKLYKLRSDFEETETYTHNRRRNRNG